MNLNVPQYNDLSSLNSLLMASLYSENSRNLIIKKSKSWDTKDKYKSLIKNIVNKNKQKKDITYEISLLQPDEIFLNNMYFLKEPSNARIFVTDLKKLPNQKINWIDDFIIDIYRGLGLNCLDIYYLDDNSIYLNLYNFFYWKMLANGNYKTEFNKFPNLKLYPDTPDILIIFHKDLNKSFETKYILPFIQDRKNSYLNNLNNPNFKELKDLNNPNFKDFINFNDIREEFEFNGELYILDSVLLRIKDKSIVGFRCDGEKYVYNNFSSNYDNPCSIIKFDWSYNKGEFCYNPYKCELEDNFNDINDLCFDFNNGDKTLIFIKKEKEQKIPDIPDNELLEIIKQLKIMKIPELINFIKKYNENILKISLSKEELEKFALKIFITNYIEAEKVKVEEEVIQETPSE